MQSLKRYATPKAQETEQASMAIKAFPLSQTISAEDFLDIL